MALCDSFLTQDITIDCNPINSSNIKNKAWLFNYDDIDETAGFVDYASNELEGLTLKADKRGYIVEQLGKKPFGGSNTAFVAGTYRNTFTHQVKLYIPYNIGKHDLINEIANGKYVIVMENDSSVKNVYGAENGLTCTECTRTVYDDESDGGWIITLEETKAKSSGLMIDKDSEDLDDLCKTTA